ncbi:MAG: DUF2723 domain-containing protein [Deltaproteobacteria bacterium]|nr:DUF2723 domain-containing protein [Deltaproteobacteria bacterium]
MRKFYLFTLLFLAWIIVAFNLAPAPYWRDSAEFVITGAFLDIAHPAGYPLLSQLSNMFALLPFGTLAFRVNAFCGFVGVLVLFGTAYITYRICVYDLKLGEKDACLAGVLSAVLLALVPAFIRQLFQAEAYLLNTLSLQALFVLYHRYLHDSDLRHLLLAAFIAGLSLGNHVSIALSCALMLPIMLYSFNDFKKVVLPGILLFTLGLGVYAYIPVRADSNLPLNTGAVSTFDRFIDQVTASRDFTIRSSVASTEKRPPAFHLFRGDLFSVVKKDFNQLLSETNLLAIVLAGIGLVSLPFFKARAAFALLAVGLGNWIFFTEWMSDPWIPLFMIVSILVPIGLVIQVQRAGGQSLTKALVISSYILLAIVSCFEQAYANYTAFRDYDYTEIEARNRVRDLPYNSPYIIEPSAYLSEYAYYIEGYRDDLLLTYLPDLFYPGLFEPFSVYQNDDLIFKTITGDELTNIGNIDRFIGVIAPQREIYFEPIPFLIKYLKGIVRVDQFGGIYIQQGQSSYIERAGTKSQLFHIQELANHGVSVPSIIENDELSRLDLMASLYANLWTEIGDLNLAHHTLQLLCKDASSPTCTGSIRHNLNVYQQLLNDKPGA